MLLRISHLPATIECPRSFNNVCGGSVSYTAINCITLLLNWVLRGQSFHYVLVYNFTKMHAMSQRSEFFASRCRVNIWGPMVCYTVSLLSVVFRVRLPRVLIPTSMSDSKSLTTSLLKVMISSKNECVFIPDLSNLTMQIIFDAWWAAMNVGSKWPSAWHNSRHEVLWRLYLHCRIEETGSPGIIYIVCHQVLHHPSEHGTSSMGKHLLAEAHIAKWNEFTDSEVTELTSSMVEEIALDILTRQGSRGITIVCSQRKIIFDIMVDPYWLKWQTKCAKLAAKECQTSEFHRDTRNCHLMLRFVSAHFQCNAISNVQLRRSYKALLDDLVLPSTMTFSNICRREYAMSVDAITKLLPSGNKVSLALDGWTSTNQLALMSVNAYHMDRNWVLYEVQLAFDEVERLFFSYFES